MNLFANNERYGKPVLLDRNMAYNIREFRKYGKDSKLLRSILLFMAVNHQQIDLFGFYKLDPARFAEIMNLNREHLFRKHPQPYFIGHREDSQDLLERERKEGRMSPYRTWSTELENALYILTHVTIFDDYHYKTENGAIMGTQRFNYLDEIRFELVDVAKTQKIIYYYKPNPLFEKNLKNYFLLSKVKKYLDLKKPRLDEAYLDLTNRINIAESDGKSSIVFNIDTISDIMNIQKYAQFSKQKAKVTEKFEKLRSVVGDDKPGLDLTWARSDSNMEDYANKVQGKRTRKVDNLAIISWDLLKKEDREAKESEIWKYNFNLELNRALIRAFFNTKDAELSHLSDEAKKEAFYGWMLSEEGMDIKEIKYQDTYVDIYKSTRALPKFKEEFVKTVTKMARWQNEFNCFSYNEDQICFTDKKGTTRFSHFYELYNFILKNHS